MLDIVAEWLTDNRYDGLFSIYGECGCEIADLMPCECDGSQCEPGYKAPCDPPDCPADGECDWHIQRDKPGDEL